jgi:hypothetical protein
MPAGQALKAQAAQRRKEEDEEYFSGVYKVRPAACPLSPQYVAGGVLQISIFT